MGAHQEQRNLHPSTLTQLYYSMRRHIVSDLHIIRDLAGAEIDVDDEVPARAMRSVLLNHRNEQIGIMQWEIQLYGGFNDFIYNVLTLPTITKGTPGYFDPVGYRFDSQTQKLELWIRPYDYQPNQNQEDKVEQIYMLFSQDARETTPSWKQFLYHVDDEFYDEQVLSIGVDQLERIFLRSAVKSNLPGFIKDDHNQYSFSSISYDSVGPYPVEWSRY